MSKIGNTNKFLNYLNKTLDMKTIELIYDSNQITLERCDLYKDFITSLFTVVFETYMGDSYTNKEDRVKHFKWCWDKNINSFIDEGIIFGHSDELYEYFLNFIVEVYYAINGDKDDVVIERNIKKLWGYIFNYQEKKTQSDVDTFIEVYKMFDKSIKLGKKLGL